MAKKIKELDNKIEKLRKQIKDKERKLADMLIKRRELTHEKEPLIYVCSICGSRLKGRTVKKCPNDCSYDA